MTSGARQSVVVLAPRSAIAGAIIERLQGNGSRIAALGRDLTDFSREGIDWSATCDLTDFEMVHSAVLTAREELGGLTGLVNCAGSMLLKPAHLTTAEEFQECLSASLGTAFAAVRAAKDAFQRNGGSVVLISSAAATLGMGNHEAIAAAKAGIEGLARSAAATYASSAIRFNVVAPGLVESPLSARITGNAGARRISEQLHPLGSLGQPEDVSRAVCWLLDPAQRWVTGQVLGVDGGLASVQPRPRISAGGR